MYKELYIQAYMESPRFRFKYIDFAELRLAPHEPTFNWEVINKQNVKSIYEVVYLQGRFHFHPHGKGADLVFWEPEE
jgi:hypothetical protein